MLSKNSSVLTHSTRKLRVNRGSAASAAGWGACDIAAESTPAGRGRQGAVASCLLDARPGRRVWGRHCFTSYLELILISS